MVSSSNLYLKKRRTPFQSTWWLIVKCIQNSFWRCETWHQKKQTHTHTHARIISHKTKWQHENIVALEVNHNRILRMAKSSQQVSAISCACVNVKSIRMERATSVVQTNLIIKLHSHLRFATSIAIMAICDEWEPLHGDIFRIFAQ